MKIVNRLSDAADGFVESNLAAVIMSLVLVCVLWESFK